MPRTLPERELRPFLQRKRRERGPVDPPPVGQWLAQTLELAGRLVPCEAGSLLLDDPGRKGAGSPLTFVASFGPVADELIGMSVPAGEGIVGRVYATGRSYRTDAPRRDPYFYPRVDQIGGFRARSLLGVPVRLEQEVCGVFELLNRRGPVGFSERDLELAELLARYVSSSILNAVDILKQNHLALHDDLTGVRNVRGLDTHLEAEVTRARSAGTDLAVLFVDVDRLKRINDRFGHTAGSETLRAVGRSLSAALGDRGTAFRFGGDEFVLVCPALGAEEAERLAEELRWTVAEAARTALADLPPVSISVGVATLHTSLAEDGRPGTRPGTRLLTAADHALYRAKDRGRDRAARATPEDDTLRLRR
ncbi:MAG: diguanylate cyclase domain-containing protein [Myxococcota bacterium]